MAIQRRYVEHRRWMVRSFSLTFAIITTRICGTIFGFVIYGGQMAEITGPTDPRAEVFGAAGVWFGVVLNLMIADWWLERGTASQRRARKEPPAAGRAGVGHHVISARQIKVCLPIA